MSIFKNFTFYKNRCFIFILGLIVISNNLFAVSGKITDKKGKPIVLSKIVFTNSKDNNLVYETKSDTGGNYTIDIPLINSLNGREYTFFNAYPNPFHDGTVIPFYLNKSASCYVVIYNVMRQKVRTLLDRYTAAGFYQLVWDGTTDQNQRVTPGVFFVTLVFEGKSTTKKVIMQANNGGPVFLSGMPNIPDAVESEIVTYNVSITSNEIMPFTLIDYTITDAKNTNFIVFRKLALPYKVSGKYLSVNKGDNTYDTIFINGINLGIGKPGTYPGEMAATTEDYRRWFDQMSEIGYNTIRVYTLHFPRFYDELAKYNQKHIDKPLYLLQGIWLDEDRPNKNMFTYTAEYDDDIAGVIDCMHGNKVLPEITGRAYGKYQTNISPWILGYIIGREIHPDEVQKTNKLNSSVKSYFGNVFSMPYINTPNDSTSPIECWLTERLNNLVLFERQKYQNERPVSVTSWPTLDPFYHPSEHLGYSLEDVEQINMGKMKKANAPAGFYITYHAYPYYPAFMTDEPGWNFYYDQYGMNPYIAYLGLLWQHYIKFDNIPVLIGEYGVPSSWGDAHTAASGMSHGGHDYDKQGFYNLRLLGNIHDNLMAGGCMFSWIDEWFKQTWITNPMSCNADRRRMWHNLASPEQNFGMLTFIPDTVIFDNYTKDLSYGNSIKSVKRAVDFQYFHLNIEMNDTLQDSDSLIIAFDTYDDAQGESILPDGKLLNHRSEFFLTLTKDSANLFVTRAYNTYGIYFIYRFWQDTLPDQLFHSIETTGAPWDLVSWKNDINDTAIQYIGRLRSRNTNDNSTSLDAVIRNKNSYNIRIPWQLINYADPSQNQVLADYRSTLDTTETRGSDGIAIEIFYRQSYFSSKRMTWDPWGYKDQNSGDYIFPKYKEVPKKTYYIIKEGMKNLNLKPLP